MKRFITNAVRGEGLQLSDHWTAERLQSWTKQMENLDPQPPPPPPQTPKPPLQIRDGEMALFGFYLLDFILHFGVTWASPAFLRRVILTTLTLSQELKKVYAIVSGISLVV